MNFFSTFVASFCAACVFIGGLFILCPSGAMSRSVKYIFTLVFVLTVISAAAIAVGKWEYQKFDFTTTVPESEELDINTARYVYAAALQKSGIDFSEITVCTDKTTSGGISISKVIICSDCESQRILSALEGLAENIEVEIKNE